MPKAGYRQRGARVYGKPLEKIDNPDNQEPETGR